MMLAKSLQSAAGNAAGEANYIEDVFSTWLYTGNGSTQTITNGIDLAGEGGLVWLKRRDGVAYHNLIDTVRGAGNYLFSNTTDANIYSPGYDLTAFNSNGFSLGPNGYGGNANGASLASWTFRKQPKFFDVVTYTGAGSVDYAHALGSVPGFALYKATNGTSNWNCVCRKSDGTYELLQLNTTASTFTTYANAAAAGLTSTTFNPSPAGSATPSTQFVAYLFAHDSGGFGLTGTDNVISCGSFTVDGSGNASVNLGYEPQWILFKASSRVLDWSIHDTMRGMPVGSVAAGLYPNLSAAESNDNTTSPTATGFTWNGYAGETFVYVAIRRGPMKVPTDGTSVFEPVAYTGTGATNIKTNPNFPPDLVFGHQRNAGGEDFPWFSRLTGTYALASNNTAVESDYSTFGVYNMNNVGYTLGTNTILNGSGSTYVNFVAQRAPGFFDEVCWTGNNSTNQRVSHNLGVAPELIIYKGRNKVNYWRVYFGDINKYIQLDAAIAAVSGSNFWGSSAPTTTDFGINCGSMDLDSFNAVGYLFATCPGVSKVGTYTGTATTLQINCGFTAGARFVLIKRTDSTGDWYVWDSARGIVAGNDPYLLLNSTAAEVTSTDYVDTYSAGFELTSTAPAAINASGGTFIFLAIA